MFHQEEVVSNRLMHPQVITMELQQQKKVAAAAAGEIEARKLRENKRLDPGQGQGQIQARRREQVIVTWQLSVLPPEPY